MNLLVSGKEKSFDISWQAITKIVLAVFAVYFLYLVKDILFLVFASLVISVLFNPAISFLQKLKISRGIATATAYLLFLGLLFFSIYWVMPVFKNEIYQIVQRFPFYFEKVAPFLSGIGFEAFQNINTFLEALREWLVGISTSGILDSVTAVFGGMFLTVTILSLAVFFSLEERGIEAAIKVALPRKYENKVLEIWNRTQIKISGWFAARFLSMVFVGILAALLCLVLDISYPVFFGIMAFITDLIPFIGPLIFGVILFLFALIDTWQKAVLAAIGVIIIHQIEGNVVTPLLTRKFMEFPATLVLISLLVGEQLWGLAGAILAIPLFGLVYDFAREFLEKNKD